MDKWNGGKGKRTENVAGIATKSLPSPADYPLASVESRAAARALVQDRDKKGEVIEIVLVSPDGTRTNGPRFAVPSA